MTSRCLVAVALALGILGLAGCEREAASPPSASAPRPTPTRDVPEARDMPDAAPALPLTPVDPGAFPRFGCNTDAIPPHIVTGRATVTWRPVRGSGAFSYRNLPARCGGAYPGQLVDGARTRPGDGAEFVVCMPDERRLDTGILRRGAVPAGAQDVAHRAGLVRMRLGLERFVNLVSPADVADPEARLVFGPRLRSARGTVRLGHTPEGPAEGTLEFEIDCGAGR